MFHKLFTTIRVSIGLWLLQISHTYGNFLQQTDPVRTSDHCIIELYTLLFYVFICNNQLIVVYPDEGHMEKL